MTLGHDQNSSVLNLDFLIILFHVASYEKVVDYQIEYIHFMSLAKTCTFFLSLGEHYKQ